MVYRLLMTDSLCSLDGRYADKISDVIECFGEKQLIRNKILVEVGYFLAMRRILGLKTDYIGPVHIYLHMEDSDYLKIQQFENVTKHDIKAIQEFVQYKLQYTCGFTKEEVSLVHWGLTSQDIVNTAYYLSAGQFHKNIFFDLLNELEDAMKPFINNVNSKMIAYTHGQAAIPTTFAREMVVFEDRLVYAYAPLVNKRFECKFGGAVGTLAGHYAVYPDINWEYEMDEFCSNVLDMSRCKKTTQTDNYQSLCLYMNSIRDIANVCADMCADMWLYAFNGTIILKSENTETGSSTMPQKINPIKFENAEGNFELCSSMIEFFTRKLSKSRLQRDLSDSTVMRNVGMIFGYFTLGVRSLIEGLQKIEFNGGTVINKDKACAEYIQLYLTAKGYPNAYETVKNIVRNNEDISVADIFNELSTRYVLKKEHTTEMIKAITNPDFYLGNATPKRN